jgi:hypothetical protein
VNTKKESPYSAAHGKEEIEHANAVIEIVQVPQRWRDAACSVGSDAGAEIWSGVGRASFVGEIGRVGLRSELMWENALADEVSRKIE